MPVRVESLSRFSTQKQQKKISTAVADGNVDIIIGTHKLLNKSFKFNNLGLVIIDEEHRFGVRQHDLEIRGGGELLGSEQSGLMQEIGYNLYTDLLERAVNAIKSGQQLELDRPLEQGTEINLHTSALLPSTYLPDVHTRLIMYKRIANAPDVQSLDDIQVEMIDRFGLLPDSAKALIAITELKLKATKLSIRKIDFGESGGTILFDDQPNLDPQQLINLIQSKPSHYKLEGEKKLHLLSEIPEFSARCEFLERLLKGLM